MSMTGEAFPEPWFTYELPAGVFADASFATYANPVRYKLSFTSRVGAEVRIVDRSHDRREIARAKHQGVRTFLIFSLAADAGPDIALEHRGRIFDVLVEIDLTAEIPKPYDWQSEA